ncbi:MAG: undecaprenyl/decaprenyl-phosphate alpha-N-acetylglucosaminyl 1-phosphate transferase [Candidatus Peribacter sp.]|jgi:UDP-GlcNAc:undecaprenyl-phosphate/decaprenyl-phosphate GlcNAc-1-phosphate transferase|nr:undecaprenyl/decaprenyl-phosphate alpha-N-acetylglucosaminyl 1-phosphate transferase [Candidatus Peribacter sp.]MBT4392822.1 undecaprenyl/decaprenyl-phosphate alpha-N-acetylglucosaminyl 1-phosphate transferase [Candidatus Peribacter sp.]MBT4601453.1 undecaprenyl/decaprenyl-phosphate alpha-N-acetylglucosaminyl 1-phosphate transferase [Candidatus Peribacter sp.]MBT5148770.1 undecaprenyl/decaprenyl-phosphate alpha-N-acetylglucosaminyl 1-phosphate transferase [Candidatus Peribacter sp.]MBT563763
MNLVIIPAIAFTICALLHRVALTDFVKLKLLDNPEKYGMTRRKLPYPTGILSVLTFLVIFAYLAPWTIQSAGIFGSIFILALVSFIDDRRGLDPKLRLFMQALVAFLIFATGSRVYTLTNPLLADGLINLDTIDIPSSLFGPLPLLSGIFTIFWLMLCMNALNWFDGIPGQVSTLSTIGFLVIGLLSLSERVGQTELALIAFVLAGISFAGLLFDFPPNKVLMGDTGAMFFGLMLGVLTLYTGGKVATAFLVLGVPLIDVFLVIIRRLSKGVNPMRGNATDEHLHHRLLSKGWSERKVILLTAGLGTLFGVSALFLSSTEKLIAAGVLLLVMIGLGIYSRKV